MADVRRQTESRTHAIPSGGRLETSHPRSGATHQSSKGDRVQSRKTVGPSAVGRGTHRLARPSSDVQLEKTFLKSITCAVVVRGLRPSFAYVGIRRVCVPWVWNVTDRVCRERTRNLNRRFMTTDERPREKKRIPRRIGCYLPGRTGVWVWSGVHPP